MCWHISFALIFFINFAGCRSLFTKWIHTVYNEDANGGEECLTFCPGTKQMWIVHSEHGRQRGTNKLTQTVIFAYAELSFLLSCGGVCVHLRLSRSLSRFSPPLHCLPLTSFSLFFASFIPNHCKMLNCLPPHFYYCWFLYLVLTDSLCGCKKKGL